MKIKREDNNSANERKRSTRERPYEILNSQGISKFGDYFEKSFQR